MGAEYVKTDSKIIEYTLAINDRQRRALTGFVFAPAVRRLARGEGAPASDRQFGNAGGNNIYTKGNHGWETASGIWQLESWTRALFIHFPPENQLVQIFTQELKSWTDALFMKSFSSSKTMSPTFTRELNNWTRTLFIHFPSENRRVQVLPGSCKVGLALFSFIFLLKTDESNFHQGAEKLDSRSFHSFSSGKQTSSTFTQELNNWTRTIFIHFPPENRRVQALPGS